MVNLSQIQENLEILVDEENFDQKYVSNFFIFIFLFCIYFPSLHTTSFSSQLHLWHELTRFLCKNPRFWTKVTFFLQGFICCLFQNPHKHKLLIGVTPPNTLDTVFTHLLGTLSYLGHLVIFKTAKDSVTWDTHVKGGPFANCWFLWIRWNCRTLYKSSEIVKGEPFANCWFLGIRWNCKGGTLCKLLISVKQVKL